MKKLLLLSAITFVVFACHTKEEQNRSGINDPTNLGYGDIDSSVLDPKKQPNATKPVEQPKQDTAAASACIDSTKINPDAICTQEYAPVCGCDNKTYSNKCMAEKAGVTSYKEGECPGSKTAPKKKKRK